MAPMWLTFFLALPLAAAFFGKLWLASIVFFVPLSWALIGGATWAMYHWNLLPAAGVDRAYHDTYYVVAQFRYHLFTAVFLLGLPALWLLLNWAKANHYPRALAVLALAAHLGVVLAMLPQHLIGRFGMPRRYIDYPEAFAIWNRISSWGAMLALAGTGLFLALVAYCILRRGKHGPTGATQ